MKLSGKLTFNRVAIKMITVEKKNKSGLILPDTKDTDDMIDSYEDHPLQGLVCGIGSSVTVCKEGDTVLLKGGATGYALLDKGTLYSIISESDIVLVRENGGTE